MVSESLLSDSVKYRGGLRVSTGPLGGFFAYSWPLGKLVMNRDRLIVSVLGSELIRVPREKVTSVTRTRSFPFSAVRIWFDRDGAEENVTFGTPRWFDLVEDLRRLGYPAPDPRTLF